MEVPLKVAEIDHVVLRCRDQNRALDFYTRVLGLSEERRIVQIGLIQLRAGRSMIDLVPASDPRVETGLNVDHVCIGVEARDLNEVVAYLRGQSVEVIGEPAMRYGARGAGLSIYVKDPEGNVVEAQADASVVVNAGAAAGRIARLLSDKQDCQLSGQWAATCVLSADLFLVDATLQSKRLRFV